VVKNISGLGKCSQNKKYFLHSSKQLTNVWNLPLSKTGFHSLHRNSLSTTTLWSSERKCVVQWWQ